MGDRTSYQITIGGKMTAETLVRLLDACEDEGLGLDWEGFDPQDVRAAFFMAAAESQPLTLNAHEVNYGNADAVESFCRSNALPYVKEWDAGGGFGPGCEVFDGENSREYDSAGIGQGGAVLSAATFKTLATFEAVAEWFSRAAYTPPAIVIEGRDMNRAEAFALASRAAALPQIINASPRRSGGAWAVFISADQGVTVWHDADDDSRWNPPPIPSAEAILAAIVTEWEEGRTGWRDDAEARLNDLAGPVALAAAFIRKTAP